jgi:hypothetical protein
VKIKKIKSSLATVLGTTPLFKGYLATILNRRIVAKGDLKKIIRQNIYDLTTII